MSRSDCINAYADLRLYCLHRLEAEFLMTILIIFKPFENVQKDISFFTVVFFLSKLEFSLPDQEIQAAHKYKNSQNQ